MGHWHRLNEFEPWVETVPKILHGNPVDDDDIMLLHFIPSLGLHHRQPLSQHDSTYVAPCVFSG